MHAHLIHSNHYDISFWGLNRLHPFDGLKFSKAWKIIAAEFKATAHALLLEPPAPVSDELLLMLHDKAYLQALLKSKTIAQVIEIGAANYLPNSILQKKLIHPLKLACNGTVLAVEMAINNNAIAMNFGGGYHHAFADHGEGFCFFGDAALSILNARHKDLLHSNDKVLMIDLDAHRGNGFYALMGKDPSVRIFDMYNFQTYPGLHPDDPHHFPFLIPLKAGLKSEQYLDILKTQLVNFLNQHSDAKLVLYNAGNDIFEHDHLGGMKVDYKGVVQRDQFVLEQLTTRNIPTAIMTSGGYGKTSHQLIAELAKVVINVTRG